ncbi:MAG: hypothetical protein MR613_03355 [Prevotella sp.]|nr:hypothetical protein [Prevotella sp.]
MQVVFSLFSLLFSMLQASFAMLICMLRHAHLHASPCSSACFAMLISMLRHAHYMFSLSA